MIETSIHYNQINFWPLRQVWDLHWALPEEEQMHQGRKRATKSTYLPIFRQFQGTIQFIGKLHF